MNNFAPPPRVFQRIECMQSQMSKLIALCFLFGAPAAQSQTLDWGSLTGSSIVDSQGSPLDNTFLIQMGAFDAGFTPTQSNISNWSGSWHTFDTAAYAYNPLDGAYFTGTQNVQNVPAYASLFEGLQGYLWIRNGTKSEYLLASASTWTFPLKDPGCCPNGVPTQWSVSDLGTDVPIWGSQLDNHGGGTYDGSGGPYDLQTHAVPESASSLLALLGGGLVLIRRRRLVA